MKRGEVRIKKSTLWIIAVILLILLIIVFWPFGSPSGGSANMAAFTNNPILYPSLGPDTATNTVIEFADFQCPVCGIATGLPSWSSQYSTTKGYRVLGQLEQAAQQGQIRFIFVTMSFLGQGSVYAAEAGFCANEQGKFWQMHDAIYSNQVPPAQEGVQFTKQQLEIMAGAITGLNQTKFTDCLESDKYASSVQQANTAADGAGIKATPTVVANGKILSDWTSAGSVIA